MDIICKIPALERLREEFNDYKAAVNNEIGQLLAIVNGLINSNPSCTTNHVKSDSKGYTELLATVQEHHERLDSLGERLEAVEDDENENEGEGTETFTNCLHHESVKHMLKERDEEITKLTTYCRELRETLIIKDQSLEGLRHKLRLAYQTSAEQAKTISALRQEYGRLATLKYELEIRNERQAKTIQNYRNNYYYSGVAL